MTYDDSQHSQDNSAESGLRPRVVEGGKGLVVTRIGKSFKQRPVVRSVSLSVKRGEVIGLSRAVRVLVATRPVDIRKGTEGLAVLGRDLIGADLFDGAIYVFRDKR